MDILDFEDLDIKGDAILLVHTPDHRTSRIHGLSLDVIRRVCPLLALSFEDGASRKIRRYSMQVDSVELIRRFLWFIYHGSYILEDGEGHELPCSMLMHARLLHYGELFDMPVLVDSAYTGIIQICELHCCLPYPPPDLCETIQFLYEYVKMSDEAHECVVHYSINCFDYHGLGNRQEFKQLVTELKPFEQDLFRCNMERGFEDEGSPNIIQLPFSAVTKTPSPDTNDYIYDMFGSNDLTPLGTPVLSPIRSSDPSSILPQSRPPLPSLQALLSDGDGYNTDSSQACDREQFTLIRRFKPSGITTPAHISRTRASPRFRSSDLADDEGSATSDTESTDSGWTDIRAGSVPQSPAHIARSHRATSLDLLYKFPRQTGSKETVFALSNQASHEVRNDHAPERESSDSEWSLLSD